MSVTSRSIAPPLDGRERLRPVAHADDRVALVAQGLDEVVERDLLVLGDQDPQRRHRGPSAARPGAAGGAAAAGSVSVNVVPAPSALSTRIVPPWRWTIPKTIASPRPGPALLRREEGLEDLLERLRRDADAGVRDADRDARRPRSARTASVPPAGIASTALTKRLMKTRSSCSRSASKTICGGTSSARNCTAPVSREAAALRQAARSSPPSSTAARCGSRARANSRRSPTMLLSRRRLPVDVLEPLAHRGRRLLPGLLQEALRGGRDVVERVVQLVRHPGGERPDRRQLLGLHELALVLLQLLPPSRRTCASAGPPRPRRVAAARAGGGAGKRPAPVSSTSPVSTLQAAHETAGDERRRGKARREEDRVEDEQRRPRAADGGVHLLPGAPVQLLRRREDALARSCAVPRSGCRAPAARG